MQSVENLALAQVWNRTAETGYHHLRSQGYAAFLTEAQKCRLERIRQAKLLFAGQHRTYFLEEGRTQFKFKLVEVEGMIIKPYSTLNLLGLIATKGGDLLFGQAPILDCADEDQWSALQELVQRCNLTATLLDAAVACGAEGECFLEAIIHTDGQVYIRPIPNEEIFPLGGLGPDGQYPAYLRLNVRNDGTAEEPQWKLLETTIRAGMIERHCFGLTRDLKKETPELPVERWQPGMKTLSPTGIDQCTVVWIPNQRGAAVSDFDCALDLQDGVNAANTQIDIILMQHANPKMGFHRSNADSKGNVPSAADAIFVDDMTQLPRYVTWDPQLLFAFQNRAFKVNQLLVRTETSPVLLGLKEGAAPDAYKKVRLEAFNSLTKAARRSLLWTTLTQLILLAAQKLDNTRPGIGYRVEPVGVTLRDGIPVDETEQATNIATLRAAGSMSRRRSVLLQVQHEAAADVEVAQIELEAAEAAPSVVIKTEPPPKGGTPNETPNDGDGGGA